MSAKATKRPLRSLTAHEKLDAIRRVHDGESKASVARDIGVPESTLRGWCKNEDKISYLSRQSSPETDESMDHISLKKPKLEEPHAQPFNLSMKNHNSYSTTSITEDPKLLLNLNTSTSPESTPKSTNTLSERDRNRAELARLSVELGLNRPEMFLPTLNNSLTDFSTNISLLTQWNALLAQQQQLKSLQSNKSPKIVPPPANEVSSSNLNIEPEQSLPKDLHSVQESVWYWLKSQQSMLNMNQMSSTTNCSSTNGIPTTGISTLPSSSNPNSCNLNGGAGAGGGGGIPADQSSWFWKWYKQFAYKEQESKPILYQQLTKEVSHKDQIVTTVAPVVDQHNAENLSMRDNTVDNRQKENDKVGYKVRSVLDNLLFNNNNNDNNLVSDRKQEKEDDDALSQSEAVEHGEKFLKWLESCSDPSVTAVQIMQFKTLLNNVKTGVDRKNSDLQNKAKVKRK